MHGRAVIILCDEAANASAEALRSRLTPAGADWRVEVRSLGSFAAEPESRRELEDSAFVVLSADASRSSILQVLDQLLGAHSPTIVVSSDGDALRDELEPQGVVVLDPVEDPALIQSTLRTLVIRQSAVEHLSMDLRIAKASHGGISGQMARLHDELELAGKLQRRFLPVALPTMDEYSMGVLFRPCGYVSGDIYDVVKLDEHRTAFVVADAVGHGVPAALLTLVIAKALRSTEFGDRVSNVLENPARALEVLNAELCHENEAGDRFATAVCGVLDTRSHEIRIASGGHPPCLIVDRTGGTKTVEGGAGPLLGIFPEAEFEQATVTLGPGQTLLLYSDGFETAFPRPDEDPARAAASEAYVRHFAETVRTAASNAGLQKALERLAESIDSQSGSLHQRDDLTALALGRIASIAAGARSASEVGAAA